MLLAGDEMGRTQKGNNNAYCQDNSISWVDWHHISKQDESLLSFTQKLSHLRKTLHLFNRDEWFTGQYQSTTQIRDLIWLTHQGQEMNDQDWQTRSGQIICYLLSSSTEQVWVGMYTGDETLKCTCLLYTSPSPRD